MVYRQYRMGLAVHHYETQCSAHLLKYKSLHSHVVLPPLPRCSTTPPWRRSASATTRTSSTPSWACRSGKCGEGVDMCGECGELFAYA